MDSDNVVIPMERSPSERRRSGVSAFVLGVTKGYEAFIPRRCPGADGFGSRDFEVCVEAKSEQPAA